jgi:hypothetical protein
MDKACSRCPGKGNEMTYDIYSIVIPNNLGVVVARQEGTSPFTIFLIKNVVGDVKGQQRACEIVRQLYSTCNVKTVYTDTIRDMPSKSRGKAVEVFNAVAGLPELMSLSKELNINIRGMENTELHERNQKLFQSIRSQSEGFDDVLDEIEGYIEILRQKFFSSKLLDFEDKFSDFDNGNLTIEELLSLLDSLCQKGILNWGDYPILQMVISSYVLPKVDSQQVNQELRGLVAELVKNFYSKETAYYEQIRPSAILMTQRSGHTLQDASDIVDSMSSQQKLSLYTKFRDEALMIIFAVASLSNGKVPSDDVQEQVKELERFSGVNLKRADHGDFLDLVIDLSTFCNIDIENYPHLKLGAHALRHRNAIYSNWNLIMPEIENFRINGCNALARSRESVDVLRIQYHLDEMRQLIQLQSLPEERHSAINYAEYKVFRSDLTLEKFLQYKLFLNSCHQSVLARLRNIQPEFDHLIREALEYYDVAADRANSLSQNIFTHMEANGVRDAILVATGYLEPYIIDQLNQEHFSYISINPKIDDPLALAKTHLDSLELGSDLFSKALSSLGILEEKKDSMLGGNTIQAMEHAIQQQQWQTAVEIGEACLQDKTYENDDQAYTSFSVFPMKSIVTREKLLLLYYLALSHAHLKQFDWAMLYIEEARSNMSLYDNELNNSIKLLFTQLEDARKDNEIIVFVQSLESHIKDGDWSAVINKIESYCTKKNRDSRLGFNRAFGPPIRLHWDDPLPISIPPLDNVHPIILFYLARGYSRIDQYDASKKVAEFTLTQCGPEHDDIRSQLEGMLVRYEYDVAMSKFNDILQMIVSGNLFEAVNKISSVLDHNPQNSYAYCFRVTCYQFVINETLNSENPDSEKIESLRAQCNQINNDLKLARQYAPISDKYLQNQLDQLENKYREGVCGQIT